ncbi:hypothetical protein PYJP_02900 [Pyrofollis japonicus]|uniref:MoaD/ThiS family protein n=1 Tax=Pyrofollis japonicus TaxID=3060460 RepID=UPI00295B0E9C|nr:MoaD/ThiS family protein [Pyrofollis japonicus]BEP16938.1 hypothetical protein PYJP_02900 [Pyrofollis japonicus]
MSINEIEVIAVFVQEFYELIKKHQVRIRLPKGSTVRDLVEYIDTNIFPGFRDRVIDEEGRIKYPVEIAINGRRVDFLKGLDTELKDGDRVLFSPRALFVV